MTDRLVTSASQLRAGLRSLKGVIERHNTIPILSCVCIKGPKLYATDLYIEVCAKIAASESSLEACVDYFQLWSLVHTFPGDVDLTLETDEGTLHLSFPGGRYRLNCLPVEDWQHMKLGKSVFKAETSNFSLASILRKTRPFISTEETRYYLNGACIHTDGGGTNIVATDGHKLIATEAPYLDGCPTIIIPAKAVRLILDIGEPQRFKVTDDGLRFWFDFGGVTLVGRAIDGSFPDWRRVVPRKPPRAITLDKGEFRRAARRLAMTADKKKAYVSIFQDDDDRILVGSSHEGASYGAEIMASAVISDGEPLQTLSMNISYLLSVFDASGPEDACEIKFQDAVSPLLTETDDTKIVLMPIRTTAVDMKLAEKVKAVAA